ncbi:MAG: Hsp20/alpha crystallin family protein [Bacteroidota bacterium]
MQLVHCNPTRALATFPNLFDNFFLRDAYEDLFPSVWMPAIDVAETDDEYVVKVELPGVNKDDVRITVQENILTVRGEKKRENERKESNFHRVERSYGSFQRSFTLPTTVKADKIDATYKEGLLTITLPKAEEAKPKAIDVKVK